jgi:hypothetical protein
MAPVRPPGPSRWRLRLLCVLAASSLVLLAATLIGWCIQRPAGQDWAFFSTYWRGPVVVGGHLEFGHLGQSQPFIAPSSQPWTYRQPTGHFNPLKSPDYEDALAHVDYAQFEDLLRITSGRIVPPTAWNPTGPPSAGIPYWQCSIPIAYVIFLFAVAPGLWVLMHVLPRGQLSSNICPSCGYDLRATPDRCPECGAVPPGNRG